MPLDPQAQAILEAVAASGAPSLNTLPVADARKTYIALRAAGRTEPKPVGTISDREIPGLQGAIPIRIYTPEGKGPFPVLVYFHGGGWVLGDLDTHDPICRSLTNAIGCVTISVDYPLAPEHKFPVAVEDCYTATAWVADNSTAINGEPARIAVGGDSSGGNLAAAVTLIARDRGGPKLVYQLLIYPVLDYHEPGTASYRENAEGYYLTREEMVWFWNHYVSSEDEARHPYASPLQAKDLSNLPTAMIITAEFDPLRDEGEMYVTRLKEAGVPVTGIRYHGMIHGFVGMATVIDQGKRALADASAGLRSAFEAKSHQA